MNKYLDHFFIFFFAGIGMILGLTFRGLRYLYYGFIDQMGWHDEIPNK